MAIEDKEIGLKIGSPLEKLWTNVKKEAELSILKNENSLIINKEILKLANKKIKENKL